jgi:hypothetical protein
MSQSSPEGIILGPGSKLVSLDLSINKEKVLSITQKQDKKLYSEEDLDMFRKFMIQEQNFSKSCLDVFIEQFKKK